MKILHVVSSYWPAFEFGGPIQSVHSLNKYLVRRGIEVVVYTTNAGLRGSTTPLKREVIIDGVKVFYFPYRGYVHYTFSSALFFALKNTIKNFDLIHATGVWNFPVSAAAFWARYYKKPYIISPRGSLMKEPLAKKRALLKKIFIKLFAERDFKNADLVHFTAGKEKDEYLKLKIPLKKSFIILNGLDPEDFEEFVPKGAFRAKWNLSPEKKIILFLSRLGWKKGLDTLIPAFAQVIKEEPRAFLVLEGAEENSYKKVVESLVKNHKLEDKVLFTGSFPGKDVAALQDSDVFVLPSYSENFGMAVIQAMYFGLPVVITEGVGIAHYIESAEAGLVIKKDEKQLAEAILKILNNPDLARKMGDRGKQLVAEKFSISRVVDEFINVYNDLIKK